MDDNKPNQSDENQACTSCGVAYQDNSGVKSPGRNCNSHAKSRDENESNEKNNNDEPTASLHASRSCC